MPPSKPGSSARPCAEAKGLSLGAGIRERGDVGSLNWSIVVAGALVVAGVVAVLPSASACVGADFQDKAPNVEICTGSLHIDRGQPLGSCVGVDIGDRC